METTEPPKQPLELTVTDRRSQAVADREAWRKRTPEERLDAVEATFIGKEDLLRNKRASGRHRALGDVEELL